MWFLSIDFLIIVLDIFNVIVLDFIYKNTLGRWNEDIVTYIFSEPQIHLANQLTKNVFPEDFLFGVGVLNDGRESQCVIDEEKVCTINNITQYTSLDSHYEYKEDILLAKSIGAQMFKISLSWAKILPYGFANFINEDAIRYYNDVINEIIANDMTPMVILFDWDLPHNLQLLGGCTNPMLVQWFEAYARIAFEAFGDRLKFWVTINEANLMAYYDRNKRTMVINQSGIADYLCGHNVLLAHAKVYNMYNENFRQSQNGKVGIIQFYVWMELLKNESQTNTFGLKRGFEWYNGWLTHPIFSRSGDYSKILRDRVDFKSRFQGFSRSRLPYFTDEEVRRINGSADFLGINFYKGIEISTKEQWKGVPSFKNDADIDFISENERVCKTNITLSALDKLLEWLNNDYVLPEIYITENGYADTGEIVNNGEIVDINRIIYLRHHISQVMKAMQKGINIRGYLIWPLIDDFERGTFGLFHVNSSNNDLIRIPKSSSRMIGDIYKSRTIHPTTELEEINFDVNKDTIGTDICR